MSSGFSPQSSLFGTKPAETSSSLFGSGTTAQTSAPLLALPAPPTSSTTTNDPLASSQGITRSSTLFGTSTTQPSGLGLFGNVASTTNVPSNLFSNPQTTSGGLFGSTTNQPGFQQQQQQSSNLFGAQQPSSSNLFTSQPSSSGLFSGIQSTGITGLTQPSPLTLPYPKDTNFADLPMDMQKALTDLESTIQSNRTLSDSFQLPKLDLDQLSTSIRTLESQLGVIETVYERVNCTLHRERYDHDAQQRYCEHIVRIVNSSRKIEDGHVKNVSYMPIYSPPSRDNEFLEFELNRLAQLLMELETTILTASKSLINQDKQQQPTPDTLRDTMRSQISLTKYLFTKYNAGPKEEVEALRRRYNAFRARYLGDNKEVFSPHVQYK